MTHAKGYAAHNATDPLLPFDFERREVGPHDVRIDILFCGVCHSDLHVVRNEWGGTRYPLVPGHEIIGRVTETGKLVSRFKKGDMAGVGCFVDSCRTCPSCREGLEQYCDKPLVSTYNYTFPGTTQTTFGGYSSFIIVDENYILHIPDTLDPAGAAPLLCAGITTWSPLRNWKIGPGHKVAVNGLGGLGHMALKFGVSFGAEVTILSSSPSKEHDARLLGAHHFCCTNDTVLMGRMRSQFDFIIDTVSAPHDLNAFLTMLRRDGTMVLLGVPPEVSGISPFSLIGKRKRIAGSMIGGIRETQEMLDYCGEHRITSEVEVIPASRINEAFERMLRSDVKYRFVIDIASLS